MPNIEQNFNRQNAILKAGQLYCIAIGLAVLLLPILELAPAHEIARVGKGRYPPTVVQARVPADMIDVKVGTEHDVHRLWRYARLCQAVEKAAPSAPMELRNERTFLFLADAAVEQDRTSVRVEHEGLDGKDQLPPRCVQMVRVEQGTRRFDRARRDPGEGAGDRELEPVDINHDVYRAVARTESHNLRPCQDSVPHGGSGKGDQ